MVNFTYKWHLSDLTLVKKNGLKVFSCFSCGGGSTMGYKMAGCEVIGCNEIDPKMMANYRLNHNPKYSFLEAIQIFKLKKDLPSDVFNIDILDGSPPCSSFSIAGNREENWGEKKRFREGQQEQILDDLFFHFIDLAKLIRPKIIIAENVKGMLIGNAKGYVKEIIFKFKEIGYEVQLFLLNAATMGVPQRRERVFFIARRVDLSFNQLKLSFNEKVISVKEAFNSIKDINYIGKSRESSILVPLWKQCKPGESFDKYNKGSAFSQTKIDINIPARTLMGKNNIWHFDSPRSLSQYEFCVLGSYPIDYKFIPEDCFPYLIGMSVPPIMMFKIVQQIINQWF
jgi:DNA (cytosine-5)-methyltransferase 1